MTSNNVEYLYVKDWNVLHILLLLRSYTLFRCFSQRLFVPVVKGLTIQVVCSRQAVTGRSRWEHKRFLQSQSILSVVLLAHLSPRVKVSYYDR